LTIDFDINVVTILSFLFIAAGAYFGIHYRLKRVEEKIEKLEYRVLGNGNSDSLRNRVKHIELHCVKNHPETSNF